MIILYYTSKGHSKGHSKRQVCIFIWELVGRSKHTSWRGLALSWLEVLFDSLEVGMGVLFQIEKSRPSYESVLDCVLLDVKLYLGQV